MQGRFWGVLEVVLGGFSLAGCFALEGEVLGARFSVQFGVRNFFMCMELYPRVRLAFLSPGLGLSPPPRHLDTHTFSSLSLSALGEFGSRSVAQRDVIPRKLLSVCYPGPRGDSFFTLLLLLGRLLHPEWPSCRGASGSPAASLARQAPRGRHLAPWGRRALCWFAVSPAPGAGRGGPAKWVCLLSTLISSVCFCVRVSVCVCVCMSGEAVSSVFPS